MLLLRRTMAWTCQILLCWILKSEEALSGTLGDTNQLLLLAEPLLLKKIKYILSILILLNLSFISLGRNQ